MPCDSPAFDPSPFISALEGAVDQLMPLRKNVAARTADAEKQVQSAERQYAAKVKDLRDNFNVGGASVAGSSCIHLRRTEPSLRRTHAPVRSHSP